MGFGTEILFMLLLGLVALGPKRLQGMLGHAVRAKAELENATRGIKSHLREFDAAPRNEKTDRSVEPVGGPLSRE